MQATHLLYFFEMILKSPCYPQTRTHSPLVNHSITFALNFCICPDANPIQPLTISPEASPGAQVQASRGPGGGSRKGRGGDWAETGGGGAVSVLPPSPRPGAQPPPPPPPPRPRSALRSARCLCRRSPAQERRARGTGPAAYPPSGPRAGCSRHGGPLRASTLSLWHLPGPLATGPRPASLGHLWPPVRRLAQPSALPLRL